MHFSSCYESKIIPFSTWAVGAWHSTMEYNILIAHCEHIKGRANEVGRFISYIQFCNHFNPLKAWDCCLYTHAHIHAWTQMFTPVVFLTKLNLVELYLEKIWYLHIMKSLLSCLFFSPHPILPTFPLYKQKPAVWFKLEPQNSFYLLWSFCSTI